MTTMEREQDELEDALRRAHEVTANRVIDIRRVRRSLGLSQEALARELGVTVRTVWRLEHGGAPSPLLARAWGAFVAERASHPEETA